MPSQRSCPATAAYQQEGREASSRPRATGAIAANAPARRSRRTTDGIAHPAPTPRKRIAPDRALDQFYTRRDVAAILLAVAREHLDTTQFLMIEPSAGEGAFLDELPAGSIGYDREPKHPAVNEADFLATTLPGDGPKMVVGNPPFGRNSNLAIRFFNHAAWQVDAIAFVVPRTFRKASVQNRLDRHFHLLHEEPMPANAFVFRGQPYDVPTVFQIWVRRPERRPLRPVETSHPDWEFTTPDRADFALQRIGARAGRLHRDFARSPSSHYFIRCHRAGVRRTMARLALAEAAADTAGNPSLSKSEVVAAYCEEVERSSAARALRTGRVPTARIARRTAHADDRSGIAYATARPASHSADGYRDHRARCRRGAAPRGPPACHQRATPSSAEQPADS